MTWVKQKDIDRGCPACGALRGCQLGENGLRSCISIVASAELREVRAQIIAMESEREFCLRAMKAAGEKHAAELAAVTKERDAEHVRLQLQIGVATAYKNQRDKARASTCYTCKLEWELAKAENARLRAAIAPTAENVEALAQAIFEDDWRWARGGAVPDDNPPPPWQDVIAEGSAEGWRQAARSFLTAIAARAGVKP